jgi:hypothetical protein
VEIGGVGPEQSLIFHDQKTNCMKEMPQEATSSSRSQEIPQVLSSPNTHNRADKNPPLVRILSQIYPVYTLLSYYLAVPVNITFSSTRRPYTS